MSLRGFIALSGSFFSVDHSDSSLATYAFSNSSQSGAEYPVASIFPNTASCLRLVSALLAECDEEWMTGKVYLNLHA